MFKFLHAADIHLDSPLRGLDRYEGAPADEFRGATRKALANLVRLAVDERVAFVLIVGDLYDGDWPDYNTGLFFCNQMERLREAKIPVVLTRGNHDARNRMTRDLRLPENTHFLSEERPQTFPLDDVGVMIHGQSFRAQTTLENLASGYPKTAAGWFNVGMLHTSLNGREDHDPYAPCSLDDLRSRGYGYWALGHIHKPETLHRADPFIAFPGNVQGRHVREAGERGCLLVTVDNAHNVAAEFRRLDVAGWAVCRVDAAGAADLDDLLGRVRDRLVGLLPGADGRLLAVRVELTGPCRFHAALAADHPRWTTEVRRTATEAGSGRLWVEKVVAKTRPEGPRDPSLDGPLAELTALLDELKGDDALLRSFVDRELDDLRKKLGPDLLDDLDPRGRVDQVGALLLNRLNGCGT
jgi:DNA repair exonuclease SbcCD nuclease subunit